MNSPDFILERHPHGWLIKAPPLKNGVPMDALNLCLPLFRKYARLWPGIATAAQAVMAVPDSQKAGEAWEREIEDALAKSELPEELRWLRGTDTGASSKTIFFHLCGSYPWQHEASNGRADRMRHVPCDSSDFWRCLRLLQRFPAWRERLPELAAKLPETAWPKLATAWDELTSLHAAGKLPELTERLRALNQP